MEKELREALKKNFSMNGNIEWIRDYCEEHNIRRFSGMVSAISGRIDAIKIYELGEIYTAEDVLKLLDFLLNAYREERGER